MVSRRTKPTNRRKQAKVRSASRRTEQRGVKGVSFLKDDDLDTGEELPIKAPQLTNKTSEC